jgi:hypothetical protein
MKPVLLELRMQNNEDNLRRDRSQQDNRAGAAGPCHENSAEIVGESFHVNEDDVRDQDRDEGEAGQECHEESATIVGESFDVNENDVRDQDRPDRKGA